MPRAETMTTRAGTQPGPVVAEGPDVIERIEAWVASYLDGNDSAGKTSSMQDWQKHALELFNPKKHRADLKGKKAEAPTGWKRVAIARKHHGATVIRLKDQTLVKETDLQEFGEELLDMIEAGNSRIVLDFMAVERLSCGIVPILADAARLCSEGGRGELRMINLHPEIAGVLGLSPLTRNLCSASNELSAVEGDWPGAGVPRPLPETLLVSLLPSKFADIPPIMSENGLKMPTNTELEHRPSLAFRLIIQSGSAKGRAVPILERGLVIGRDPNCQIRSEHAFLSRRHARLRMINGRVNLQDLGSTNGTLLNDQRLGQDEIEVHPGDRLEIGPLKFTVALDPKSSRRAPNEDEIADWLGPEPDEIAAAPGEETIYDVPASSHPLKREIIEDVLVLTPLDPQLLSGTDVSIFRDELAELLGATAPHRVVVNLKLVNRLSNAAVGILVAHHIRLDRMGGALRLCEPHARVAEVLNQIRLPLLLDVHSSEDEAVLSAWDRHSA